MEQRSSGLPAAGLPVADDAQFYDRKGFAGRARALGNALGPHRELFVGLTGFAVVFGLYHELFSWRLGLHFCWTLLILEVPLVLAAYATVFVLARPRRLRAVVAGLPVFGVYAAHDLNLLVIGRLPNWGDLAKLPELYSVIGPLARAALIVTALLGLVLLVLYFDRRRLFGPRALLLLPWAAVIGLVVAAPGWTADAASRSLHLASWSDLHNATLYGRLVMSGVREARYRASLAKLEDTPREIPLSTELSADELAAIDGRDVHIVVMESFLDASRLTKVRFNRSPWHDDFLALVGDSWSSSLAKNPFGGTAKSELEVLCGVPALGSFGTEEFKMLQGSPVPCLPRDLAAAGYVTGAAHPYRSMMYNRLIAYPALGFASARFLDRAQGAAAPLVKPSQDTGYVLDAQLYDQLLEKLAARGPESPPVLNYALTMEGHWRVRLDPRLQPVVVRLLEPDPLVEVLANKTYYRSKALADYVHRIFALRPRGVFIAVSDHLPPVPEGRAFYDRWGYQGRVTGTGERRFQENFLLVVVDGQVRHVGLVRHYNLHQLVLNELTGGLYCARRRCFERDPTVERTLEQDYRGLLARGLHR